MDGFFVKKTHEPFKSGLEQGQEQRPSVRRSAMLLHREPGRLNFSRTMVLTIYSARY